MKLHTHKLLIFALVAALLFSCAMLKRGAWTGGGAAGGALAGSAIGPAGTFGGAAIGAVAGQALGENDELRDGDLIGAGAAKIIYRDKIVEHFSIPWGWIILVFGAWFAWRNREHLFTRGPGYVRRIRHAIIGGKSQPGG